MLVGPNGKPIVKSEGPTGRRIILHEIMVNGQPAIKTDAQGPWFQNDSPDEQLRGRLMICNYMMRSAVAFLSDILGTFVDREVAQEVQGHINKIATAAEKEKR